MTLTKYKEKRNFKSTLEPEGDVREPDSQLLFVIHKHDATRLHYDLRLEMEGVLKSWAVPKGPSLNPNDKRLSMMVEDHPYDYKDFEGNIPEGNYGAGNVIIWDNGTYTAADLKKGENAEKKLMAGLHKGHISFVLKGKKLKGEFALVKIKDSKDNAWLLFKKNDKYASEIDITEKNRSVVSSATIESLNKRSEKEALKEKKTRKAPEKPETVQENTNTTVEFVKPMLAERSKKAFDDEKWVFEIKFDGYRTIAVINNQDIELFSRNHLSFSDKFGPIRQELKKIRHTAILDGEVVVEDESGRSHFQLLQNYQKTGMGNIRYYVFDILNLDGNATINLTLLERKELLKILIGKKFKNIIYSEHIIGEGKAFFEAAVKNNYEGIMAKLASSPYRPATRSKEWLKIKNTLEEEAIIIGITQPRGARNYFGSILLAQYEGRELKYIGNCGTGFDENTLKELYSKFKSSFTDTPVVKAKIPLKDRVQWIKPKFVCQVKFTERTKDGILRHPVFLGLRIDKKASEVTSEKA